MGKNKKSQWHYSSAGFKKQQKETRNKNYSLHSFNSLGFKNSKRTVPDHWWSAVGRAAGSTACSQPRGAAKAPRPVLSTGVTPPLPVRATKAPPHRSLAAHRVPPNLHPTANKELVAEDLPPGTEEARRRRVAPGSGLPPPPRR
uniref:Uncharacterized protein n=1 Tax=Arundo donax TaxID=35708 RepID=A0A0A9DE34_ARUDO